MTALLMIVGGVGLFMLVFGLLRSIPPLWLTGCFILGCAGFVNSRLAPAQKPGIDRHGAVQESSESLLEWETRRTSDIEQKSALLTKLRQQLNTDAETARAAYNQLNSTRNSLNTSDPKAVADFNARVAHYKTLQVAAQSAADKAAELEEQIRSLQAAQPPVVAGESNYRATSAGANRVIMFSTDWCPPCKIAKQWFKEKNIPFTEYDIEKSPAALMLYRQYGGTGGVPLIIVNGRAMEGFSPTEIEASLAI
jgi:glutaredoxin